MPDLCASTRLGHLEILRELGRGGMGVVYEAVDLRLGRRVALKLVRDSVGDGDGQRARLLREAAAASKVEHPNVVRLYGIHEFDGRLALEMQLVPGSSLRTLLRSGPLSPSMAAHVLEQVLQGLGACHDAGIVHCDLKPGNVLVDREGRVYLSDFGISHPLPFADDDAPGEADTALPWCTPRYAPPEAYGGARPDSLWDLFAVGVIARDMLPGNSGGGEARLPLQPVSLEFEGLVSGLCSEDRAQRIGSVEAALALLRATPEYGAEEQETGQLTLASRSQTARATPPHPMPDTHPAPEAGRTGAAFGGLPWRVVPLAVLGAAIALASVMFYMRPQAATESTASSERPPAASPAIAPPSYKELEARSLTQVAGTFYYTFDDGIHGRELWAMGHNSQPELVADLNPGPKGSNPSNLAHAAWGLFFSAETDPAGAEPWTCTGKSGEKYIVSPLGDLNPGSLGSTPDPFYVRENLILFYARTHQHGWEPWVTLGGRQHTALLADLSPGLQNSMPNDPRFCESPDGGYLIAITDAGIGMMLFRYAYALNTLTPISQVSSESGAMLSLGNKLLINNEDPGHGMELWRYDGAKGDFRLLCDINPGPASANPDEFVAMGDRAYFQAMTAETGNELWTTDGTASGTRMLRDINPGPADSDPYGFIAAGNHIYFRAMTDQHGRELWQSDGTAEGTRLVADIRPGPESSEPYNLSVNADDLFFTANDGVHGEELWVAQWDGLQHNATLVKDLWPGAPGAEPHELRWSKENYGMFIATLPPGRPGLVSLSVSDEGFSLQALDLLERVTLDSETE
ncbi:MAG: protein kinase [Candidatus Hydrogenedens sp.]|nr:protein kinase [Candidatus Hydrogenedens sp.]